jgi:adenylate kinase
MWVVFLGAPGCGKGTQAEYLVSDNGFSVIIAGNILRRNVDKFLPEFGKSLGEVIGSGILLPDGVVTKFIKDELVQIEDCTSKNVLFDGFPRTVRQAEALSELALELGSGIDAVLGFNVSRETVTKRILGRFICSRCGKIYNDFFLRPVVDGVCDVCGSCEFNRRLDDNEEILKKRLSEYHEKTGPLVNYYSGLGVLHEIDASEGSSDVRASVLGVLKLNEKERV